MSNEIERATSAMWACACPSDYDAWFKLLCAVKDAGVPKDEARHWCESGEGFVAADFESKWEGGIKENGAIKAASLFATAFSQGWKDPSKSRAKGSNGTRPNLPIAKPSPSPQKPVKQAASLSPADAWARCIAATLAEPYIDRKGGRPDGLKVYPASAPPLFIGAGDDRINAAGGLVVPCYAPDGVTLQTLQIIPLVGQKKNLTGASFGDGFFTVGEVTDRAYIVEGIGQAWAVNQATGCAAVVCFGAGRMATVSKVLRAKYPAARLVIVPDRGKEEQAAKIAASVAGMTVTMPTDKPGNYDANDYLLEHGTGALADLLQRPVAPAMRYALLTDADLCKLPPQQWRIKRVLPQTGLAAVFGASGSGKSFAVIDMTQAIAAGHEWFGYKSKPCNVLYCALEGEGGIAGRVAAYRIRHGVTSPSIRYLVQPFSLLDEADINDLAQAIKANGQGVEVVVLDTLNRAAPGADENDSKSMGQIIAASKQLQTLIGGLVVLVHHTGKDASKGLRGHSSLHAALDAAIEVRRDGDRREWVIAKSKDGEDGEAHPFKLDVVELGTDEDGEPITSCTVHPLEVIADSIKKVMPPKSGNQRAVWDALGEIFRKAGNVKPEGAPDTLPQGRPCITLEAAIDKTRARLVCDPKRQTERAQAAIRGLIDRELLCHEGGFVWCK